MSIYPYFPWIFVICCPNRLKPDLQIITNILDNVHCGSEAPDSCTFTPPLTPQDIYPKIMASAIPWALDKLIWWPLAFIWCYTKTGHQWSPYGLCPCSQRTGWQRGCLTLSILDHHVIRYPLKCASAVPAAAHVSGYLNNQWRWWERLNF